MSANVSPLSKWVEAGETEEIARQFSSEENASSEQLVSELGRWPASRSSVKKIVRQGVSVSQRKQLWLTVTGATQSLKSSRYEETLRDSFGDTTREDLPCPQAFLPAAGCQWWLLSQAGRSAGCRILTVIERNHPDIAFCPDLQLLVAVLLHVLDDETECYEVVTGVIQADNAGGAGSFLDQSHAALATSQFSFGELARKKAKSSYRWLQSGLASGSGDSASNRRATDEEMRQAMADWIRWIWKWVPFVIVVRIVDCYLVEGKKVLYRVALAMMKLTYRTTSAGQQLDSTNNSLDVVKENSKSLNQGTLLQCAFKIRNLSSRLIQQCRRVGTLAAPSSALLPRLSSMLPSQSPVLAIGEIQSAVIKDSSLWSSIFGWLPTRYQIRKPRRVFCTEIDGYSLSTLYLRCGVEEPLVMLVRTTTQEVFGAFLSVSLENRLHGTKGFSYFGSGETFLFSLLPTAACHRWTGLADDAEAGSVDYFIAGDTTCMAVGGGDGYGIWLDAGLDNGTSTRCQTFNNPSMVSAADGGFRVAAVELFALDDE